MKCPHCGSYFVVHSENKVADFVRAVARSNKWHCGDCHGKWKSRGKHQDNLARELLAVCFVGLVGFGSIKFFNYSPGDSKLGAGIGGSGGLEQTAADQVSQGFGAENSSKLSNGGLIGKMFLSRRMKLKDAMRGEGMGGMVAKLFMNEMKGKRLSESEKRRLREQHKDVINKMSPSEKQQVKTILKQMDIG